MAKIVWLASYPKSGNTWVRAFLTNYLRDAAAPASINSLDVGSVHSRELFANIVGLDASALFPEEIDAYRADAVRLLAAESSHPLFLKVHDAFRSRDGAPFPREVTAGAVYVIRNPLDVAVSFAYHEGLPPGIIVDRLCSGWPEGSRPNRRDLPWMLPSWSEHVESWVDQSTLPVHVVRYEDLIATPLQTFAALVQAVGLPVIETRLEKAARFSAFVELSAQEQAGGFRERPPTAARFFRVGRIGDSRSELNDGQVQQVVSTHQRTMRRFAYLDENNQPS